MRTVPLGYSQIAGIDFIENFTLVFNNVTILLVLKMITEWNAELIDIKTAFLHGEMEEQIYTNLSWGCGKVKEIPLSSRI